MLQGTGSDVGKSVLVAGLCRLFADRGLRVRPFKAQNMSNNAAVTADGGEIGRAQALQAIACRVPPSIDMNPVLIKPESDTGAQLVVHGRVVGRREAGEWPTERGALLEPVLASWSRVSVGADLVLVEGAGSPAEINLRAGDIANMGFARAADVPVVLVGDIDRGGVIAALVGTRAVLDPADAAMIEGFAINKFRGDPRLFDEGITAIERASGWPCLGVIPWLHDAARLPAEDAVAIGREAHEPDAGSGDGSRRLRIAAPLLSRIANADDADPLRHEPGVTFRFVPPGRPIPRDTDVILLFGTKSTRAEMAFTERQGWHHDIHAHARNGGAVLGLCGGFQLLGDTIDDPHGQDGSPGSTPGLGLLAVRTRMAEHKVVRRVGGRCALADVPITGYEIHVGDTTGRDRHRPMLLLDGMPEGARSEDGRIEGSYVHGLFAEDAYRQAWLTRRRTAAGYLQGPAGTSKDSMTPGTHAGYAASIDRALDGIAGQLDDALDAAARVSGASYLRRLTRIQAPLLAGPAVSGAILVFLTAYNEITVSALLWSSGNETIGTVIFNYEDGGYTTLASAMSVLVILATITLMLLLRLFARRLPAGVVPWA